MIFNISRTGASTPDYRIVCLVPFGIRSDSPQGDVRQGVPHVKVRSNGNAGHKSSNHEGHHICSIPMRVEFANFKESCTAKPD